jgi:diguanylate cyclase (GGDEF)-like protein
MDADEDFLFADSEDGDNAETDQNPWLVAVIDDESSVFQSTRLALDGIAFDGRPVHMLYAASAAEGLELLRQNREIACVLLDVVMETDRAGLDLAQAIREELDNPFIRIILRTGQPGYAPPMDVIQRYDINDYKEKTDLTRVRLYTAVACALRSFHQLKTLEQSRQGLRTIIQASSNLTLERGVEDFSRGVVTQLAAHLGIEPEGLLCVRGRISGSDVPMVVGAAGRFANCIKRPLNELDDRDAVDVIAQAFEAQQQVIRPQQIALFLSGSGWSGAIYVSGRGAITELERDLLSLFCQNVSFGFENARLFQVISDMAFFDRLTQLPTQYKLETTIDAILAEGGAPTVMMFDLDGFLTKNVAFGRDFCDRILLAVAERVAELVPNRDWAARLHTDCFAMIIQRQDCDRVLARLREPLEVQSQTLSPQIAAGLSGFGPDQGRSGFEMLRQAEMALHERHSENKRSVIAYSAELVALQQARASNAFLAAS